MATVEIATKADQATTFPTLLVASYIKNSDANASIEINFKDAKSLESQGDGEIVSMGLILNEKSFKYNSQRTIRGLLEKYPLLQSKKPDLVCCEHGLALSPVRLIVLQVKEWLDRTSHFYASDHKALEGPMQELDAHLTLRSYIVGYTLSAADLSVWGALRGSKIAYAAIKKGSLLNITRWFKFVEETCPWIVAAIQSANAQAQAKKSAKSAEGASFDIALPDTEKGVVTRFPPEPS